MTPSRPRAIRRRVVVGLTVALAAFVTAVAVGAVVYMFL